MRKLWAGLAVLAVAAVLVLYLAAGGGGRARATPSRPPPSTSAEPEAKAPEAPSDKPGKLARVRVVDEEGNPVKGAAVSRLKEKEFLDEAATGADGFCEIAFPDDGWHLVAARHPEFVQARAWVRAKDKEREIRLQRGPPLTVLVVDPLRKPVAGAVVRVSWERTHGAAGVWRWSSGEDIGEFRTGEDGKALVGAVPPATVLVGVDHPPHAVHASRLEVTGEGPVEHVVQLDAGGVLVGRVIGSGGEGVPGATVTCQELARPVATSGPDGTFRLEGVAPGSVSLVASAEGFGPGFFGGALGWGQPVPIPLKSGETVSGLEIVLSKPVFVIGRIVDDEGTPVAGVTVSAAIQRGFSFDSHAKSDAEGRFRAGPFSVREEGQVWAWFNAPHHAFEQKTGFAEPGKDVDLGEIKATRRATLRGILVDEAGRAVEGTVTLHSGDYGARVGSRSKPDGTFELGSVGPGKITLVGNREEEPKLRSRPVELETVSGQTIEGVEIVLLPARPIRGRVITPDGRPRPGAVVGVRPASGGKIASREWTDKEGKFAFMDLAEGEYEVGIPGRGSTWSGDEQEGGFLDQPAPVKVSTGREDLEFILPLKGAIVTGKVVAKKDGRPLKEFEATFLRYKLFIPSDTEFSSFRDPDGAFRYEVDEPGTWQVDLSAPGYAAHRTDRFSLAAGEVKDLGTIRLGPGGTIAGRVLDAQQRPVAYARVNILNDKLQTNEDEPFTDGDGRFEVPGVSPGMFTVFAVSPRHPLGMVRNVAVKEGERTDVQITFVDAAPLTIEVRSTSGQPVEGAALDFTFPAVAPLTSKMFRGKIPPGYGSHKSDAQGMIFQPCLPPGEVTITIEAPGFDPVTKKLDLKPGEPNRIEIRLRPKDVR
ncbi:MAG: carboxypeptidase-like regulatory domain-containing protein [Planctomycetes bacterium]|nr:carboxypeptidase-like regulatory domain-containing protein [Planctomycetota bacterium]